MKESDERFETMDKTLAKLQHGQEIIHGGWERLTSSHTETNKRVTAIESQLGSVMEMLRKIDGKINAQSSKGKNIDEPYIQVNSSGNFDDKEQEPLGYRRNQHLFANRESLIKKIELPAFDGTLPYGWICRVERVFRAGQYSETDKLDLVSSSLEGAALHWFRGEMSKNLLTSWSQFKRRMLTRFAPDQSGSTSSKISIKDSVPANVPERESSGMSKLRATVEKTEPKTEPFSTTEMIPQQEWFPNELHSGLVFAVFPDATNSGDLFVQIQKELMSDSSKKAGPKCEREYVTTLEKSDSWEAFQSFTLVCVPPLSQIDKAKCEKLQEALSKCSNESVESHFPSVGDNLPYDCGKAGLSVAKVVQVNTVYIKEVAALNHQVNDVSGKNDAIVISAEVQRLDDVIGISSEHGQLQQQKQCYKTWHFKYKDERKDFLYVEQNNRIGSDAIDTSDALISIISIYDAGVNKRRKMIHRDEHLRTRTKQKWSNTLLFKFKIMSGSYNLRGLAHDYFAVWHCWKKRNAAAN